MYLGACYLVGYYALSFCDTYVGFTVSTPSGDKIIARAMLLCSVDLPARAILLCMKQFNGRCGCCYCEDTGKTTESNYLHRWWPFCRTVVDRSHTSIIGNARSATESGASVG